MKFLWIWWNFVESGHFYDACVRNMFIKASVLIVEILMNSEYLNVLFNWCKLLEKKLQVWSQENIKWWDWINLNASKVMDFSMEVDKCDQGYSTGEACVKQILRSYLKNNQEKRV